MPEVSRGRCLALVPSEFPSFIFPYLSPKYFKKVPGEGMPLPEDPTKKGDLFIYFDIQFPTRLRLLTQFRSAPLF